MLNAENKYRVFISYSHQDAELVDRISSILEENGLQPMLDKGFSSGHGFTDQIKNYIAHAHVFIPVITKESSSRGWVHQEIGYAMALNIPVLPISSGQMPGQMIQELQSVRWEEGKYWRRINKPKLYMKVFKSLVRQAPLEPKTQFASARYQEKRIAFRTNALRTRIGRQGMKPTNPETQVANCNAMSGWRLRSTPGVRVQFGQGQTQITEIRI